MASSATATEHDCLIWQAFAELGIGEGASGQVKGGGPFGGKVTITVSFPVPDQCASCTVTESPETSCSDGDDCDGAVDCDDSGCSGDPMRIRWLRQRRHLRRRRGLHHLRRLCDNGPTHIGPFSFRTWDFSSRIGRGGRFPP